MVSFFFAYRYCSEPIPAVFTNTGTYMEIMASYVSYSNVQYRPAASYKAHTLVTHTHEILTGSKRVQITSGTRECSICYLFVSRVCLNACAIKRVS